VTPAGPQGRAPGFINHRSNVGLGKGGEMVLKAVKYKTMESQSCPHEEVAQNEHPLTSGGLSVLRGKNFQPLL
jgi:hypothetical protein